MKIFVAGASSQRGVCHVLIQTLKHQGHEVHDWTCDPGYGDPARYSPPQIKRENLKALDDSDGVIWVTGNVSEGAGYEVGRAEALGKKVVILDIEIEPMYQQVYRQFERTNSLQRAVDILCQGWRESGVF